MGNPTKKVCFVGQMRYMHHRKKLAGIMHYANLHPDFALQQFDYTQIPPRLCQELLSNMKLDGIIYGDGMAYATVADSKRRIRIPTAVIDPLTFDFKPGNRPDLVIELNHAEISNRIADYFIRRRFRHFAYIGYDSDTWIPLDRISRRSALREKAFVARVGGQGRDCSVLNVSGRFDSSEKETVRAWLFALPKPCAIMAYWDNLARDVADIAKRSGVSIPEQVSIMGTDNDVQICESASPTLTTMVLGFENAGLTAASELSRIMCRPRPGGFARKILYGTFEIVERTSTRDSHGASRIVSDACEYIRARATDVSLDLEDIAEHVHVSPRILQLRFAEVLGHSVIAEVSAVKLAKVKDMLEMSDLPIATVAEQCGYTPHHLANFFKRKFGCSMSDWRRRQIETVSACS